MSDNYITTKEELYQIIDKVLKFSNDVIIDWQNTDHKIDNINTPTNKKDLQQGYILNQIKHSEQSLKAFKILHQNDHFYTGYILTRICMERAVNVIIASKDEDDAIRILAYDLHEIIKQLKNKKLKDNDLIKERKKDLDKFCELIGRKRGDFYNDKNFLKQFSYNQRFKKAKLENFYSDYSYLSQFIHGSETDERKFYLENIAVNIFINIYSFRSFWLLHRITNCEKDNCLILKEYKELDEILLKAYNKIKKI